MARHYRNGEPKRPKPNIALPSHHEVLLDAANRHATQTLIERIERGIAEGRLRSPARAA